MARIGVEYLDHFEDVRASGIISDGAEDLTCPYYIAEWLAFGLADAGHELKVHHANKGVNERHMLDATLGGDDDKFADSVDLYMIITHGNYENHVLELLFDVETDSWIGESKDWFFGDHCGLKWLMIYGCQTIDGNHILDHLHVFRHMHLFCGSYGYMYDSWTVDDVGSDLCEDLLSGELVSDSWGGAVSDWWVSNHPMVISVESQESYNNGNIDWSTTLIGGDHLYGAGPVMADVPLNEQFYMAVVSWSGGIYG
jgi:hypothetical protein